MSRCPSVSCASSPRWTISAEVARLRESGALFILEPQEIGSEFGRRRIVFYVAPDGVRTEIMQIITDTGIA